MRDHGIYRCRFFVACPQDFDAKKPAIQSRFWPEIRKLDMNGRPTTLTAVRPDKAIGKWLKDHQSTHRWMSDDVNLAEYRLVGPFDFDHRRSTTRDNRSRLLLNFIDEVHWKELERMGHAHGIDVDDVRTFPSEKQSREHSIP